MVFLLRSVDVMVARKKGGVPAKPVSSDLLQSLSCCTDNAENGKNAEDGNDNPLVVSHGSLRFFDDIHSTTYDRRVRRRIRYGTVVGGRPDLLETGCLFACYRICVLHAEVVGSRLPADLLLLPAAGYEYLPYSHQSWPPSPSSNRAFSSYFPIASSQHRQQHVSSSNTNKMKKKDRRKTRKRGDVTTRATVRH